MPSKLRKAIKGVGKVAGFAANFVPGGAVVRGALGIAGKLAGGSNSRTKNPKHKKMTPLKYAKAIQKAKLKARLDKIKMSAYKGL